MNTIQIRTLTNDDWNPGSKFRGVTDAVQGHSKLGGMSERFLKLSFSITGFVVEKLANLHNTMYLSGSPLILKAITALSCAVGMLVVGFSLGTLETILRLAVTGIAYLASIYIKKSGNKDLAYGSLFVKKALLISTEMALRSIGNSLHGALSIAFSTNNLPNLDTFELFYSSPTLHRFVNNLIKDAQNYPSEPTPSTPSSVDSDSIGSDSPVSVTEASSTQPDSPRVDKKPAHVSLIQEIGAVKDTNELLELLANTF